MCTSDNVSRTWLEQKLIPELKTSFNKTDSDLNYSISFPEMRTFISRVFFLDLVFNETEKAKGEQVSVVVKQPSKDNLWFYEAMSGEANFHNEILFYTKFAKKYKDYPQCLYIDEKPPYDSVIVIENITKQGYHLCSQMVNLDTKFSLSAVREIGKLHARAYIWKDKNPDQFFQIINDIQPTKFGKPNNSFMTSLVNGLSCRGVDYLRKEKYDETFFYKVEPFLKNAFENIILEVIKPIEPLATLCHGDFTRNNVFFRETDIIQVKLIDFGMLIYGSPAIDLSTFLCLSCSRINRKEKFPEVFDAYHETVIRCLKEAELSNLERFSKDKLLEDFKQHALFGYIISTYFLPVMLDSETNSEKIKECSTEELIRFTYEEGGEEVSKILADMLLDLKELGCLDHILY